MNSNSSLQNEPQPLVSIVIPAFNASGTLAQTLTSVLAQTYSNIEVIVVDDGSTDATAQVLKTFGHKIHTLYQPNKGLPSARNAGCQLARGEFIALMDADDLCRPERIALQVEVMAYFPQAVLCSTDFAAFNNCGPVAPSYGAKYYSMIQNASDGLRSLYSDRRALTIGSKTVETYFGSIYRELVHGNFVHPPTVLFRRSVLKNAGMFDETLRYTCDWEWMVRVSRLGPFVYVHLPMLDYRLSEVQMSARQFNGGKSALDVVRAAKKIWHADPDLLGSDRHLMRKDLGEFSLDAAEALADRNKIAAAKMLLQSIWFYGALQSAMLRVLLKILLPRRLIRMAVYLAERLHLRKSMGQWFGLDVAIPFSAQDIFPLLDTSNLLSLSVIF